MSLPSTSAAASTARTERFGPATGRSALVAATAGAVAVTAAPVATPAAPVAVTAGRSAPKAVG